MKWIKEMKWTKRVFSYLLYGRLWDFEGRCTVCGKNLDLILSVLENNHISLISKPCQEHPGCEIILWPQREDIERI
jgi:hypothetical protein